MPQAAPTPATALAWTPQAILGRIAHGFTVLVATTARDGPTAYSSAMPEVLRDFGDHVGLDWEPGERIEEWMSEIEETMGRRYSAEAIALADEALSWPHRYLADKPLQLDAIWLTAFSWGVGADLEKILRRRRVVADRMVERRKQSNPDVIRIYEDDAADAATKIVFWANAALDRTGDPRAQARIRQGARIRFGREIRATKAIERRTYVRRCDVIPGKLYSQSRVHYFRCLGAQTIAEGLAADSVPIR